MRTVKGKAKLKKPSLSQLKKKLWKACSDYIRLRDKGICFTCGRFAEGSGYHAGHFIPRSVGGITLYYDEANIFGQCFHCNINLGGYGAMFHQKLVQEYGQTYIDDLWDKKRKTAKWTPQDYLDKTAYYKAKHKALLQSPPPF